MSNLHRVQWIDSQLREGRFPNCARIAEEFGISVRQAARDVEYLKYSLSAPVEYSFARRGFFYSEKTFVLPALFLGEEEREALHYLADRFRTAGGEATARLAALFEKLDAGGARVWPKAPAEVQVHALKPRQVKTYSRLKTAAAGKKKVRISYLDGANRRGGRVIHPYLVFIKGKFDYVHAFCETRRAERDFRLDRIDRFELLDEGFTVPASFDPRPYANGFRFDFRIPYRAVVRFDHPVHADCPLPFSRTKDGDWEAEFTDSSEFLRKLLAYSIGFSILAPRWLREKCGTLLASLLEKNRPV
jgi:predicted DNA-binding transcriptional regulator YafY